MTDKDRKGKFGKRKRADLSKRIKKSRKSSGPIEEKPKKPDLDLDLIERRIREELKRQLGKEAKISLKEDDTAHQLNHDLLSQRIREELHRQLDTQVPSKKQEEIKSEKIDIPGEVIEEIIRSTIDRYPGREKAEQEEASVIEIDRKFLEKRVRAELQRQLIKSNLPMEVKKDRRELSAASRSVIEERVKEELAKHLGKWKKQSSESEVDLRELIDMNIVDGQIRRILRKSVEEMCYRTDWELTDEDLDRIIHRSLIRQIR